MASGSIPPLRSLSHSETALDHLGLILVPAPLRIDRQVPSFNNFLLDVPVVSPTRTAVAANATSGGPALLRHGSSMYSDHSMTASSHMEDMPLPESQQVTLETLQSTVFSYNAAHKPLLENGLGITAPLRSSGVESLSTTPSLSDASPSTWADDISTNHKNLQHSKHRFRRSSLPDSAIVVGTMSLDQDGDLACQRRRLSSFSNHHQQVAAEHNAPPFSLSSRSTLSAERSPVHPLNWDSESTLLPDLPRWPSDRPMSNEYPIMYAGSETSEVVPLVFEAMDLLLDTAHPAMKTPNAQLETTGLYDFLMNENITPVRAPRRQDKAYTALGIDTEHLQRSGSVQRQDKAYIALGIDNQRRGRRGSAQGAKAHITSLFKRRQEQPGSPVALEIRTRNRPQAPGTLSTSPTEGRIPLDHASLFSPAELDEDDPNDDYLPVDDYHSVLRRRFDAEKTAQKASLASARPSTATRARTFVSALRGVSARDSPPAAPAVACAAELSPPSEALLSPLSKPRPLFRSMSAQQSDQDGGRGSKTTPLRSVSAGDEPSLLTMESVATIHGARREGGSASVERPRTSQEQVSAVHSAWSPTSPTSPAGGLMGSSQPPIISRSISSLRSVLEARKERKKRGDLKGRIRMVGRVEPGAGFEA